MRFQSHVLVTGGRRSLRVGIQRNRVSPSCVRYDGRPGSAREGARRLRGARGRRPRPRSPRPTGSRPAAIPSCPPSVLRETRSELLPHVLELPRRCPRSRSAPGIVGRAPGPWGSRSAGRGAEAIGDESCRRFDGADEAKIRPCAASGSARRAAPLGRLESRGNLPDAAEQRVRETIEDRTPGPSPRRGPRASGSATPRPGRECSRRCSFPTWLPVDPAASSAPPGVGRSGIAEEGPRGAVPSSAPGPGRAPCWRLLAQADARLRAMAVRNLERVPDEEARPWLERARADPIPSWREPPSPACGASRRRRPRPSRPSRAPRPTLAVPAGLDLRADRRTGPTRPCRAAAAGQSPGATLRTMTSPASTRAGPTSSTCPTTTAATSRSRCSSCSAGARERRSPPPRACATRSRRAASSPSFPTRAGRGGRRTRLPRSPRSWTRCFRA